MYQCLYGYHCTIGEVIIWDLNKDDDMIVASSGIGDDSHREPVCKVQWIPDPESKGKKYHVSTVLRMSIQRNHKLRVDCTWQTSPEVQNRGISGQTKMTRAFQKKRVHCK